MKKNPPKNKPLNRYDKDWLMLVTAAKQYGFSKQEIRNFLSKSNHEDKTTYHENSQASRID